MNATSRMFGLTTVGNADVTCPFRAASKTPTSSFVSPPPSLFCLPGTANLGQRRLFPEREAWGPTLFGIAHDVWVASFCAVWVYLCPAGVVYVRVHGHTHRDTHTRMDMHTYSHTHGHTHTLIRARSEGRQVQSVDTHTHTHTHSHTHTHTTRSIIAAISPSIVLRCTTPDASAGRSLTRKHGSTVGDALCSSRQERAVPL